MTELARCESGQSCVLFDLDGTLIDHDSTSGFLRQRLCGHPFRLLAACLVLPLLGPLMVAGLFKTGVASTLMWIATVGLDRAGLDAAVRDYLAGARHKAGSYPRACAELRRWQRRGVAAIVVTASAQILAEPLCEDLGLDVQVIGSTLTRRAGGWVAGRHVLGEVKVEALAEFGMGESVVAAYSDSISDLPMLVLAQEAHLVNVPPAAARRMEERLVSCGADVIRHTWEVA